MRGLAIMAAAAGLAVGAAGAEAATVRFEITANCATDCAIVDAFMGQDAGGTVTIDTTGFAPGAAIAPSAFVDYSFIFGDVDLGRSSAQASGASGFWGATPEDTAIRLSIALGTIAPIPGAGFSLSVNAPGAASQLIGSLDASCVAGAGSACVSLSVGRQGASIAPDPRVRVVPTEIPTPPALGLLVAAVAALGLAGRRRARARTAAA